MRVAALISDQACSAATATACWIDLPGGCVLNRIEVPFCSNLELIPKSGVALIHHTTYPFDEMSCVLDIYHLADWSRAASLSTECRTSFNASQSWRTIYPSPENDQVYLIKTQSLGDELAQDVVCGLDLRTKSLSGWEFHLSQTVLGWTGPMGQAHGQFLLAPDDSVSGSVQSSPLGQSVGFWLGPDEGMGPVISLGPRPRSHSDPGQANAICCAAQRTVVVRNDGRVHLLSPNEFRQIDEQNLAVAPDEFVVNHAAVMDPEGRLLYAGVASWEQKCTAAIERVIVHDLIRNCRVQNWELNEPLQHLSLTECGRFFVGSVFGKHELQMLDARNGAIETRMNVAGPVLFLVATSDA